MAEPSSDLIATRGPQMFPRLAPDEMRRLGRFGEIRRFASGDMLMKAGDSGHGLAVILSGRVEIVQRDETGRQRHVVTHETGSFMGELAQLSGRPSLVDARALSEVEAIVVSPERLRALLIAEADLGERIMRALILRRVGLIERGAGPVIVGHESSGDVLRLVNFLRRNGHPYLLLDSSKDSCGQALLERFDIAEEALPIVLCPGGQLLRNQARTSWPAASGWLGSWMSRNSMTW